MGKRITDSRWFYIIISLLLAFVLWIYVGKWLNPEVTNSIRNVQVVFSGLEKLEERGLMISEGEDQTVTLRVRARREVFSRLSQGDITVTVDVSGISEPSEQSVSISSKNITFPRSITAADSIDIQYTSPSVIKFTVSNWASKEVEVKGVFTGSVADGYQRGEFSIAPEKITISGQEELVNQVDYARVTVSQQDMQESYIADCGYTLVDYNGDPIAAGSLTCDPMTVLVTLPVVVLKEIPLTVNLIAGGGATEENATVKIEPVDSIMVSGDKADVEGLKSIYMGDIALSKIYGTDTFERKIQLAPELVNVSGVTEVTITVSINGLSTRTMKVDEIEIINKPDGYAVEAVTKSCSVLIRGKQETVDAVMDSQLRIVADLSDVDLSIGSQTVPVKVYLDGSSEVGVVGDYSIVISLSRQ